MDSLSAAQVAQFVRKGYVKLEQAFAAELADQCREILWQACGCDKNDPSSWISPVVRIGERNDDVFRQAANTASLQAAFDQLAGPGNWIPKESIGSFPVRFPSPTKAADTGWHVDASFPGDDPADYFSWRINIHSRGRALLMLFLFSDTSEKDAPTILKIGSHQDVARMLQPAGEKGLSFLELASNIPQLPERPEAVATGKAGDVYLCHPFIVHAAQDHRGSQPKFMAQPALQSKHDFDINADTETPCPVAAAIIQALVY